MIFLWLCYATIVLNEAYKNLPGATYKTVDTGEGIFTYAQNVPSILPILLKKLLAARKVRLNRKTVPGSKEGNGEGRSGT